MHYNTFIEQKVNIGQRLNCALITVFWLVSLIFGCAAPQHAIAGKTTTATSLEIIEKAGTTRLFIELSGTTGFTASVLPDPYRVIIDLSNVAFDLPPGIGHRQVGLISQVRYGIIEKGKSRIVVDTLGPVLISQTQMLAKKGKSKPRIALDLVATTPEAFKVTYTQDQAKAAAETTASLPLIVPAVQKLQSKPPGGRKVIVIDAGHGGIDPGALSPGKTKEKDVVLAFAKTLEKTLAVPDSMM